MNSRKFVKLCLLFTLVTSTAESTLSLGDENLIEVPDVLVLVPDALKPRIYCGIELKIAVRKFCREKVIEAYRPKDQQIDRSLNQKSRKCGAQLMQKCCLERCSITTFVQLCPYRYV
jgi:hypothetical protein